MKYTGIAVKILLPVIFPVFIFAQQNKIAELSAPIPHPVSPHAEEQTPLMADREQWKENIPERTVFSSSYITPDGRYITHYSKAPLNYYDASGTLQPIVFKPKANDNGWAAMEQPFPTYLFNDGSAAVSPSKDSKFIFGKNITVNGNAIAPRVPVMESGVAKIHNIIPGMDKEYAFRLNGVKYNYVLNQPVQTQNGFLTIGEELEIPAGYVLKRKEDHGREQDGGWSGDLILYSPSGETVSIIYAPLIFDASKAWALGSYKIENVSGHTILKLQVNESWLNDISRTYPVTIDPLIIGPTALYPNVYMPSCLAPAYNSDSILVTIPAQIAITKLVVTASFYADPFTTAVMSQGAMWFSTSCNSSVQFTIPNPAGNMPGTAYLDTFDLRSPLMCCFPQSCSQRTFYLRMHLNRTGPSTGCNTTYIRYDPFTTLWPFEAFVEGRTVETFGNQWNVQSAPICTDQCTFTAAISARYGVPPLTITHPWMVTPVVVGNPTGCSFGASTTTLTLTRPNCPTYCDPVSQLAVPPPTVTDACGNTISGLVTDFLNMKNTPQVTATPSPDSLCSGEPVFITLSSCVPNSTISWTGTNSSAGTGNIFDTITNTGNIAATTSYQVTATVNGCTSPPVTVDVVVDPDPVASFTNSNPAITGVPVSFTNTTPVYAGNANVFAWNFGDSTFSGAENPIHTYNSPGTYTVCFFISTDHGCSDTVCREVEVIPAEIVAPNVITPNSDNVNDLLVFKYLEFYSNNHLDIFDRWGMLLLSQDHYANNWDGSKYTDGTYYYVLTVQDNGKEYHGFFQLIK